MKKALLAGLLLYFLLGVPLPKGVHCPCPMRPLSETKDFYIPASALPGDGRQGVSMGFRFVTRSGAVVTLTNPRWATKVGGFYPLPGYRWLVVDVSVKNPAGNFTVCYTPVWFSLVLDGALEIPPAPVVGSAMSPLYLRGGQAVSGTLIFSAPQQWMAREKRLVLRTRDWGCAGK